MGCSQIYILVEGDDDERLIKFILSKFMPNITPFFYKYAQRSPKDVARFITTIKKMSGKYLFFRDLDFETCITKRKEKTRVKYTRLDNHAIVIVKAEIESWYLAGLDVSSSSKLGVKCFPTTDSIMKEQFEQYRKKKFASRIDFMSETIKHYSIDVAQRKNTSLMYFFSKLRSICNN